MLYGSMIPLDLIVYIPKEIIESKGNRFGFVYEVLKNGKTLYENQSDEIKQWIIKGDHDLGTASTS